MCGIVGVYDPSGNAGAHVVDALLRGQHRGQDGAGASFLTEQGVITHKGHGLVAEVFRNVEIPRSRLAIGHVRYGTQAASLDSTINDRDASPLEIVVNGRTLGAIVHNGDFVGGMQLLEQYNGRRKTGVDTELFVLRFVDSTAGALDQRVKDALLPVKEGAYSLIGLVGDQLFAVRDPLGIRPLVFAAADGVEMFASESYMCNGFQNITDVGPGSLVMVGDNHPRSYQSLFHPSFKSARCAFEFIYFSRPESVWEHASDSEVRRALGKIVAQQITEKPDMVAAVPDSGNCFGSSLSYHVGVESVPALLRNHYPGRVFIVEGDRKLLTKRKISIDSHAVRGKHLLIADDSSVRGTTAAELVERCYAAGAARVDMAISFPLWSHPCKYGINTKSANELLGARVSSLEDAAVAVGAKKFYAPTPVEVRRAIMGASRFHLRENDLCMACVTGDYPISVVV